MDWILVIGMLAATCVIISYLPQAIKSIRTRHTKDISLYMYIILVTGGILWIAYGILSNDIPIIIANTITTTFAGVILVLKIKYG